MWNYLPKVNRVIKLPSSMTSASWMGIHFTNDDLVKESRMADDFDFEITREGIEEGRAIIHIARPAEAAVVWGKVVAVVERDTWLPRKLLYYDEDLRLARTMSFAEVGSLGGPYPGVWVVPEYKTDEKTEIFYENISSTCRCRKTLLWDPAVLRRIPGPAVCLAEHPAQPPAHGRIYGCGHRPQRRHPHYQLFPQWDGMMAHTVANATNLVTGEVQVHGPGYLADLSLYNT